MFRQAGSCALAVLAPRGCLGLGIHIHITCGGKIADVERPKLARCRTEQMNAIPGVNRELKPLQSIESDRGDGYKIYSNRIPGVLP